MRRNCRRVLFRRCRLCLCSRLSHKRTASALDGRRAAFLLHSGLLDKWLGLEECWSVNGFVGKRVCGLPVEAGSAAGKASANPSPVERMRREETCLIVQVDCDESRGNVQTFKGKIWRPPVIEIAFSSRSQAHTSRYLCSSPVAQLTFRVLQPGRKAPIRTSWQRKNYSSQVPRLKSLVTSYESQ